MTRSMLIATALAALAACKEDPKPDPAPPSTTAETPEAPQTITASAADTRADGTTTRSWDGDHFAITVTAPACKKGAECTATIQLKAKPGYHVNEDFPYRFTAKDAPGVTYRGKATPGVFSKADGDYTKASASEASMQVRYQGGADLAKVPMSGVFKMSVCSDASCQIEQPELSVDVPLG